MRKQLLKGLTMLMAVMTTALLTAAVTANGQSQKSKANVPFEFVVGDKTLPAGEYAVAAVTNNGETLRIRKTTASDSAIRLTIAAEGKSEQAKLVFHRYGERYFLAEVWTSEGGRSLGQSKQERAIQKELSRIALNRSGQRDDAKVEIVLNAH